MDLRNGGLAVALAIGLAAAAQADYVTGLDPQGDNFLALRAGPGSGYAQLLKLGPNTELMVLEASGNWRRVQLNDGTTGWAFGKYIAPGAPPGILRDRPYPENYRDSVTGRTGTVIGAAALRLDAAPDSPSFDRLRDGGGVIILGQSGAWLRVLTEQGSVGYLAQGDVAIGLAPSGAPQGGNSGSGKGSSKRASKP